MPQPDFSISVGWGETHYVFIPFNHVVYSWHTTLHLVKSHIVGSFKLTIVLFPLLKVKQRDMFPTEKDQVLWTEFAFLPKTKNTKKIIWSNHFGDMEYQEQSWGAVISERWGENEVTLEMTPIYCLDSTTTS